MWNSGSFTIVWIGLRIEAWKQNEIPRSRCVACKQPASDSELAPSESRGNATDSARTCSLKNRASRRAFFPTRIEQISPPTRCERRPLPDANEASEAATTPAAWLTPPSQALPFFLAFPSSLGAAAVLPPFSNPCLPVASQNQLTLARPRCPSAAWTGFP
jgi:hypothetical protein